MSCLGLSRRPPAAAAAAQLQRGKEINPHEIKQRLNLKRLRALRCTRPLFADPIHGLASTLTLIRGSALLESMVSLSTIQTQKLKPLVPNVSAHHRFMPSVYFFAIFGKSFQPPFYIRGQKFYSVFACVLASFRPVISRLEWRCRTTSGLSPVQELGARC